jgi:hypothetical protein
VVYSIIESSSWTEVERIGFPNSLTISRIILLSGTLIPMLFLEFLNNFGILLLAFRIKVNGPGRFFFISLNIGLGIGLQ